MSLDIAGGVCTRLKSDGAFLAMLGMYASEGGTPAPAVLTDPTPPDLEIDVKPVVIVGEPFRNEPDDTFTTNGRDVMLRLRILGKHNGSAIGINAVAEAARALLHNWSASIFSTGKLLAATVSGPISGPTSDPSIEGRILTLRLLIKET